MQKRDLRHKLITFNRILKTAGQNFIRNAWLSIAAIAVMVITLSIILFSYIASVTFNKTVQEITDKIDISVYLKDDVSEERRNQLIEDVKKIENVKSVVFISKDEALEEYKDANKDNVDLLLAISQTDNPLPASLRIKPRDPNRIPEIRDYLEKAEIKALQSDDTSYSGDRKEAIDKITSATHFFQRLGIFSVFVFAIVSMLIIFNTIQMAIFNRREELQIMRLLGASTWYIRGPFIVETVYYGIVAAVISVALINSLFLASSALDVVSSVFNITYANDYFREHYWIILTTQLGLGIFIGAASSYIATARYLKFKTSK